MKPKACLVCRKRKIKCDSHMRPDNRCSNCVSAGVKHCIIPQPKKRESKKLKQILESYPELGASDSPPVLALPPYSETKQLNNDSDAIILNPDLVLKTKLNEMSKVEHHVGIASLPLNQQVYSDFVSSKKAQFLDPTPLDAIDKKYLAELGCFTLPPAEMCNKYIDLYFEIANTQNPVINEHQFRKEYGNYVSGEIPSLAVLQAVLYSGAFFYTESDWTEEQANEQKRNSKTFHRRSKALLDLNVEMDTLCQIQAGIILGIFFYTKADIKTSGYSYIASNISKAHTLGMHKDQTNAKHLTVLEKRLYKRIWWSLYIKDSFISGFIGRPSCLDDDAITIQEIYPEDMIDTEDSEAKCSYSGLFFLYKVKLVVAIKKIAKTLVEIGRNDFRVKENPADLLSACDQLLLNWILNLPKELLFKTDSDNNTLLSAALAIEYYSFLLLVHKTHIFNISSIANSNASHRYSSWAITFKCAHMLAILSEFFIEKNMLYISPASLCGSATVAGTLLIFHMYNQDPTMVSLVKKDIESCIRLLKCMSPGWPFAAFFHFYLKSFYENKVRRQTIVKRLLETSICKSYFPKDSFNSNNTIDILNKTRILPRIISIDEFRQNVPYNNALLQNFHTEPSNRMNNLKDTSQLPSIHTAQQSQTQLRNDQEKLSLNANSYINHSLASSSNNQPQPSVSLRTQQPMGQHYPIMTPVSQSLKDQIYAANNFIPLPPLQANSADINRLTPEPQSKYQLINHAQQPHLDNNNSRNQHELHHRSQLLPQQQQQQQHQQPQFHRYQQRQHPYQYHQQPHPHGIIAQQQVQTGDLVASYGKTDTISDPYKQGINMLMKTFDEVIPADALPDISENDWYPKVNQAEIKSTDLEQKQDYDVPFSDDSDDQWINYDTLFSTLSGFDSSKMMNDQQSNFIY